MFRTYVRTYIFFDSKFGKNSQKKIGTVPYCTVFFLLKWLLQFYDSLKIGMIQIIGVQVSIYTRFDYPWLSEKNQCYTDVIILVYYRFILTVQRFFSPNTDFFNIHFSNQISLFHEEKRRKQFTSKITSKLKNQNDHDLVRTV